VHRAVYDHGDEVIDFLDGWKRLLECHSLKLNLDAVSGILARGSSTSPAPPGSRRRICVTA